MRFLLTAMCFGVFGFAAAQEGEKLARRYGLEVRPERYPQKTPQGALQSVVMAIEAKQINYLVAHLADPDYVDRSVADYRAAIQKGSDAAKTILAFDRLVRETAQYYLDDPGILPELRRFAKDAKFETMDNTAVGFVEGIEGRKVFLKKIEDRWFLENKQQ